MTRGYAIMVLTRFQKRDRVNDVLIFVDVSGSMAKNGDVSGTVETLLRTTKGNVSLYTSNHDLQQHYFMNPRDMISKQTFTFGGLSAVFDNLMECLEYRLKHDPDTPCDVFIISDLDDNMSMYHTEHDLQTLTQRLTDIFWNISVVDPETLKK